MNPELDRIIEHRRAQKLGNWVRYLSAQTIHYGEATPTEVAEALRVHLYTVHSWRRINPPHWLDLTRTKAPIIEYNAALKRARDYLLDQKIELDRAHRASLSPTPLSPDLWHMRHHWYRAEQIALLSLNGFTTPESKLVLTLRKENK